MINEAPYKLPHSWIWVSLDELIETLESGIRPKGGVEKYSEGIPSIGGEHLDGKGGFRFYNVRFVPKDYYQKMSRGKIKNLDILVVKDGATTGKTSIIPPAFPFKEAAVNEHVFILRTMQELLEPYYLFRFLSSIQGQSQILHRFQGTAQGGINRTFVNDFSVPLPPLPEQRRIVAKVESLFAESKTAREALDKVPVLLRRFRQSSLAGAFKGELTQRDPNDEPAQKLLEKIKQERQKKWKPDLEAVGKNPKKHKNREPRQVISGDLPDLPDGWVWTNFETVCWEITVGHVGPMANEYVEEGIPFLRSLNVRENRFEPKNLKYISREFHKKLSKSRLFPGDIVVVRSGNVGISCVIPETIKEANCSDLVIARPINGFLPEYGSLFVNSGLARDQINTMKVGVAQTHFNVGSMKKIVIPLAPHSEQKRIVAKVSALFSLADSIEASARKARELVDRIDQAILAKAFRGELLPQDPNEEPASVLLKRVKVDVTKARIRGKKKPGIRPPSKVRQTQAKPLRSIRDILREMGQATVEETLQASGLSMNEFWDELRTEMDAGLIEQTRKGNSVFLKVKD